MSLFLHFQRFALIDFVSLFHRLPDGFGQLVGAGGALEATADAFQLGDDILGLHAVYEGGHTLRVAVAAAVELHVLDDAVLYFKLDGLAARALGSVGVFHWISRFNYIV